MIGSTVMKGLKKRNLINLINSIETNHQMNMTSDHSVSSNSTLKSYLNFKSSNTVAVE